MLNYGFVTLTFLEKSANFMFHLTTPQKNIWNMQKFYSDFSISNISGILLFDEKLNIDLLSKAVNLFVKQQDGIRLHFSESGSKVYQTVTPYELIEIPVLHFSDIESARTYFKADSQKRIDMTSERLYRFFIFDIPKKAVFTHVLAI